MDCSLYGHLVKFFSFIEIVWCFLFCYFYGMLLNRVIEIQRWPLAKLFKYCLFFTKDNNTLIGVFLIEMNSTKCTSNGIVQVIQGKERPGILNESNLL